MDSSGRKIEVKTIPRLQSSFVKLGERQFRALKKHGDFWLYLVDVSERRARIFEFRRNEVKSKIRKFVHFDFFYNKRELALKLR